MNDYLRLLLAAKTRITEIGAADLDIEDGVVIDVREPHEWNIGQLPNAVGVPMGELSRRVDSLVSSNDQRIVLYCTVGERSAIAAATLEDAGFTNVVSLAGGIRQWMALGYPTVSESTLTATQRRRYARHIVLPDVGVTGQQRLIDAKVLIVGAGGLGSPAALYLAAAGVGTIGLVDADVVELSNLQRQILHTTAAEGTPKTTSAAATLGGINPDVKVVTHQTRLSSENAIEILSSYDIVVDGTDNFATRYLINDTSMHLLTPVVHGSVFRFEGQVAVFRPYETACYRCVFPDPPPADLAPDCAVAGVFGVLPGVIGTMQATEVLKLILGLGDPLLGRLLTYDALDQSTHTMRLARNTECPACGDEGSPPDLKTEAEYC